MSTVAGNRSWMHFRSGANTKDSSENETIDFWLAKLAKKRALKDTANKDLFRHTFDSLAGIYGLLTANDKFLADQQSASAINLVAKKGGTGKKNKVWIIGAHYDTVESSPGANDNASGLSVMIEVMRQVSGHKWFDEIWFVAFDMEEAGLLGSKAFVQHLAIEDRERIVGMINLDMLGGITETPNSQSIPPGFEEAFPGIVDAVKEDENRGDFSVVVANDAAFNMITSLNEQMYEIAPDLKSAMIVLSKEGEQINELRRSDHASFWDMGLPALHIGDGADTRNSFYHSERDVPANVSTEHLGKIARVLVGFLMKNAGPIPDGGG